MENMIKITFEGILKKKKKNVPYLLEDISFYPYGKLFIHFDKETGKLQGEVQTDAVGAGFHAECCERIRQYEKHFNLVVTDETAYYHTGNFSALESKFRAFLKKALADLLAFFEDDKQRMVYSFFQKGNFRPSKEGFIFFPLGAFSTTKLAEMGEDERVSLFYPLLFLQPNLEKDAVYYRNLALYEIWNNVRWNEPRSDYERFVLSQTLESIRRAKSIDKAIPFPKEAVAEVVKLLALPFKVEGIDLAFDLPAGYRRDSGFYDLTSGFSVFVPGSFVYKAGETDSFHGYREGKISMVVSTLDKEKFEGKTPCLSIDKNLPIVSKRFENEGLYFEYAVTKTMLEGIVFDDASIIYVTIHFENEKDKEFARELFGKIIKIG